VRPILVVVAAPLGDQHSGVCEVVEVMVVQALVAELAVEALDVGVLRRLAGCDQLQIDPPTIGPSVHRSACELRSLVGADRPGRSPELGDLIEHVRNVAARDPVIDRDIQALSGEVIHDRQALDAPARRERIHHEIDAPDLVRAARFSQHRAIEHDELLTPAFAHAEARLPVEPIHPLVVCLDAFPAKQVVDPPIAESASCVREVDDPVLQRDVLRRLMDFPSERCSGKPHKPAGATLRDLQRLAHLHHRLAPGLWG